MSDFYIGYLPQAPVSIAGRIRRVVIVLFLAAFVIASAGLVWQEPFDQSFFEYGQVRSFEGVIELAPYPLLRVAHPGGESRYLLVGEGKRGVNPEVFAAANKRVRLRGTLIHRGVSTAVEVKAESLQVLAAAPLNPGPPAPLQEGVFLGEIVDSKCFLGVMNPGRGKVHRDCATRCLSGGIPPALLTNDGRVILLVGEDGKTLSPGYLRFVGEPVKVAGQLDSHKDRPPVIRVRTIAPRD